MSINHDQSESDSDGQPATDRVEVVGPDDNGELPRRPGRAVRALGGRANLAEVQLNVTMLRLCLLSAGER